MEATADATKRYFVRQERVAPVLFGRTGLWVSPVGFGGYRIDDENPAHASALKLALRSGCNLIDTSANYTDGASERLIGKIIGALLDEGTIHRDELVVVTKAGYIQGANMDVARERAQYGKPFPDIVEYAADLWHCISPDFLEDQITRSLSRLGLDRIDALLLHNPEYFLKLSQDHAEYYRRIRLAFAHLEREADRGRIHYYGISSNTFPEPKNASDYTSLETVLDIATEISASNKFAVIQFPLNLFEGGALFERNNSDHSVLELASARGLATLTNRPLNAFTEGRMTRLADFPSHSDENVMARFQEAISRASALEVEYKGKEIVPISRIAWAHIIKENFWRIADILTWREMLEHRILPSLDETLDVLAAHGFKNWCDEYRIASDHMFGTLTDYLESDAAKHSKEVSERLDRASPAIESTSKLARKAIRLYRSIPGVSSVLVGMRRPEYVREIMDLDPVLSEAEARETIMAVTTAR